MSTTPALDPTQQPPPYPPVIQEHAYKPHSGHGSVGPVIGVLAVVIVLGAVAIMIGRLCSGRRVMGHLQYDFEGWMETKCTTCIDGRLDPPPPPETVPPVVIPAVGVQPQAEEASSSQQVEEQHNIHES
ncbi:hypothetical protein HanRHA438_Chr04g0201521 [Helianthus annuus]|uniref:Transmembrane protein n=1 Tax=Helianthus annuus TaxID=4232 RepID=A0A251V4I0_HELAN|nr:uncharacterized protein LOC110935367 [Helianthus annuus]KAF5812374.1 hypothetical protein HanXRQr2_Chr04g0191881 [Helianthus annuus]KAJ0582929.1 hypothetical protein HanHA300_Chr04g0157491 [Helianthus annuus]KAJ0598916.1 hypothetical protein HanHA89_Chr04g0170961 [Helianthus annuus]KAJ0763155.1 hypothetical protein HanOQP8_Chr04g0169111 [Helianthus annuus]KAJ0929124.1 hypothetical protein HanRHA438_Chr04g0201521 [Helianthus annuus]